MFTDGYLFRDRCVGYVDDGPLTGAASAGPPRTARRALPCASQDRIFKEHLECGDLLPLWFAADPEYQVPRLFFFQPLVKLSNLS